MLRQPGRLRVRRSPGLLVAAMLGLAAVPLPQAPASASCAGPSLDVGRRLVLHPGTTATVEGQRFVDGCRDTMACTQTLACSSCKYPDPPPVAQRHVMLRLVQGDRAWELGVADARAAQTSRFGQVTWRFVVPAAAKPGRARLVAGDAPPAWVRIG